MSTPAFDPEKCPVPFLPQIQPVFLDCQIPQAPDMIEECFDFDIPIPGTPGIDGIGLCPQIQLGESTIKQRFGLLEPQLQVIFNRKVPQEVDDCGFDFDVDIDLPCPPIAAQGSVLVGFTGTPQVQIQVFTGAQPCDTEFDFAFNIPAPCPQLGASAQIQILTTQDAQASAFVSVVQSPDSCEFDFDFEFEIPVPCPDLNAQGTGSQVRQNVTITTPSVQVGLQRPTGDCAFDFAFDFAFPCPQLTFAGAQIQAPQGFLTPVGGAQKPLVFLRPDLPGKVTGAWFPIAQAFNQAQQIQNLDNCTFDFGLDFALPCTDVGLQVTSRTQFFPSTQQIPNFVTVRRVGVQSVLLPQDPLDPASPQVQVQVGPQGACDFDYELDFVLPCPQLNMTAQAVVGANPQDPGELAAVSVTPRTDLAGTSCQFDVLFQFFFPPGGGSLVGQRTALALLDTTIQCGTNPGQGRIWGAATTTDDGLFWPEGATISISGDRTNNVAFRQNIIEVHYQGGGLWDMVEGGSDFVFVVLDNDLSVGGTATATVETPDADQPTITLTSTNMYAASGQKIGVRWNAEFCEWEAVRQPMWAVTDDSACAGGVVNASLIDGAAGGTTGLLSIGQVYLEPSFEGVAIAGVTTIQVVYDEISGRLVGAGVGATILSAELSDPLGLVPPGGLFAAATLSYQDDGGNWTPIPGLGSFDVQAPDYWQGIAFPGDKIPVKCVKGLPSNGQPGFIVAIGNGRPDIKGEISGDVMEPGDITTVDIQSIATEVTSYFDGQIDSGTKVMAKWDWDDQKYLIDAADCVGSTQSGT